MKKTLLFLTLFISYFSFSQDVSMEDGVFLRCEPNMFYDSGTQYTGYGNGENFITTICPENADQFTILNFTYFWTRAEDVMNIYDGDDTSAPLLGSYSGVVYIPATNPFEVSASSSNTSGCLTVEFISDDSGTADGWVAEILCATACQDIVASIDSTTPAPSATGVIGILPGDTVDFSGSATFSLDDTGATYSWDFDDGNIATGADVTNTFTSPGTYIVTLTATDTNPQGCSDTDTITVFVLGPNLVVDQDMFTVEELIEDVLIDSPCASVSDIEYSTGSTLDPDDPNGIGYFFSNGDDDFFEEGLLLTSGDASRAGGPNNVTLSDGSWDGDDDLDDLLGVDSNDATYIQFTFIPLGNEISFEFLMASEEYDMGSFECSYSDAFAFILTDSSGNVSNLAVIPDTTDPILVTNIHPDNGQDCGGVNEEYFDVYTPSNGAPIAFDGRTVPFLAHADVIPNEVYTIKLVIADDRDSSYDSGVFIKAGSFDLGGSLGEDITIASGNALCDGEEVILDTGLPEEVTHIWYKDDVLIPGESSTTLTVTEPGIYYAEFDASVCVGASDPILVEFRDNPTVNAVPDIAICSASGTEEFDLSANDSAALGDFSSTDYTVSYHLTEEDAIDNIDPLPSLYTNVSSPQTIWVRLADMSQTCAVTTSFELSAALAPDINSVLDLETCDDDSNDGLATFDLSDQTATILGSQAAADFEVTYYLTAEDADLGSNALPLTYANTVNSQPIYVRVTSIGDSDCYNSTATPLFNLVVNTRALATAPIDLEMCDDLSGDGIATFNLSNQETTILGGQDASVYNVSFHASQDDAENNVGVLPTNYENTSSPNTQTIYARVEDPLYSSCYATTSFDLIVNSLPVITDPSALEVCDDGTPDGLTEMDLTLKNSEITGGNPDYTITYHELISEAELGTNPLPTLYTNTSNGQFIFARVEDNITGCSVTTRLELVVQQAPAAYTPQPFVYCDPDNDGYGIFMLSNLDAEITGGASGLDVTYHETQTNADTGVNAIDTSIDYENIVQDAQILYARVESSTITTACATIVVVELIVEETPQLTAPTALEFCEDINSFDGYISFDLTSKSSEVLNGQDETQYILSYYENESDAESGTNAIPNPSVYTNNVPFNQIIWIRVEYHTSAGGCYKITNLELIVNPLPVAIQPTQLSLCDDLGETPGDEFTVFDLTVKDDEITGGNGSLSVAYYETNADAQSQINAIPDPTQYTNTSVDGLDANPQTLYAVVTDTNTGCVDYVTLTIRVLPNPTPTPSEDIPNIELCDDVNTGDGVEVFDLTGNEVLILNGEAGVTASYYETQEDANTDSNAIPDPTQYTNIDTPEQEIYVRITRNSTGCYSLVDFTIVVHPLPAVVPVTDIVQCELFTDGVDSFDLTTKDEEVLGGQDATQFIVSYHESLADAEAGVSGLVSPYNNTSNPQEIFVTITNNVTGCSISTQSFYIEVDEAAQANPDMNPILYEICDDEIDGDYTNGSAQFDLTTMDEDILDLQDPLNYIVTYYGTQEDADLKENPLPTLYENTVNPQVIYARVDNDTPDATTGNDTSICYAVAELTLEVNPLPDLDLDDRYILCINTNDTEVLELLVIDTYLSAVDYSFVWYFNAVEMVGETGSSIVPLEEGTYSVAVTDISTSSETNCVISDSTEVIESEPPSITIDLLTQAFADNHVLKATAVGIGVYEFSLDGGPWQDSGIFSNVSSGDHEITARDRNGCGLRSSSKFVLDYPLYFTPNGDGNHETWNIEGVGSNAKIYIFDRYGKLLQQLSPDGDGWDGTYNGKAMATDGYWFTVEYDEPSTGERKEFKAHFTLKR
ncbi:choice-of-anchor L domain-containing protein [Winogradskyella undariae]|uniref:choice-of-anchor L domain-containing protein n=1 Tax=Winogradskyella undariae TaxID=1285465 RepID=UPI002670A5C1|nr:choice-of-anchor L domain-containing protein [Winogradskyella undariae]